jgi:hypothetical protein
LYKLKSLAFIDANNMWKTSWIKSCIDELPLIKYTLLLCTNAFIVFIISLSENKPLNSSLVVNSSLDIILIVSLLLNNLLFK